MSYEYRGCPDHRHGSPERCALLLVNLGTPDAPTPGALRRYLAEFLSDPRVIELPLWLWQPLLRLVILPLRAPRSARNYAKVWTATGSPLRVESERLAAALAQTFDSEGLPVQVHLAMRYGEPSLPSVLRRLQQDGLRRLLVLPLYPQYSATTTASVFDAVTDELRTWRWQPELRSITDYYREPAWLDAVAASIRTRWQSQSRGERLLFSFHGIPKRYITAGDPYYCQCLYSAREIAARLGLADDAWQISFQSRVGREEWMQPYTEAIVRQLARDGVKRLDVVCPGFAVDCLETLEEIALQNAEAFVAAGGERLSYLPALNAEPAHVAALAALARRHGAGWTEFECADDAQSERERLAQIASRHERFLRG